MKKLDLQGGFLLRKAIKEFFEEKTEESLSKAYALLSESEVWVPFEAVFRQEDGDTENSAISKKISVNPMCVQINEELFLCAYTGEYEIKKEAQTHNRMKISFKDCVAWATYFKNVNGILIDGETFSFILYREDFEIIVNIPEFIQDEYTYVKVRFKNGGKSFYYKTEREDLCIGDKVIVPFGMYDKEKVATIIKIEKYTAKTIPFPYESTKYVLRKSNEIKYRSRKDTPEIELLGEKESYEIIKSFFNNDKTEFERYCSNVIECDNIQVLKHYESFSEQELADIKKEYVHLFDELDRTKPLVEKLSIGTHYVSELFYYKKLRANISYYAPLWAYICREFSNETLPISEKKLIKRFDQITSFIKFRKNFFSTEIKLPDSIIRKLVLTRDFRETMLNDLIKRAKEFEEEISELTSKPQYLIKQEDIISKFGKYVTVITINEKVYQGEISEYQIGNNGFVCFTLNNGEKSKYFTIDEIKEIT